MLEKVDEQFYFDDKTMLRKSELARFLCFNLDYSCSFKTFGFEILAIYLKEIMTFVKAKTKNYMLIAQLIINLKANVNKPQEPKLFKNLVKVLNWLQC